MPASDGARVVHVAPSRRGAALRHRRALGRRREAAVDGDLDLGLVVVGQRDVADRSDAAPADLHVVVLEELARVLEAQAIRRRVAVAHQDHGDDGDDGQQRDDREAARRGHRAASRRLRRPDSGECAEGRGRAGRSRRGPGLNTRFVERVLTPKWRAPATRRFAVQRYSIPSGPCDSPDRNWRTKALSELNSSSAGPDSTIRPFQRTELCSATRRALMMWCGTPTYAPRFSWCISWMSSHKSAVRAASIPESVSSKSTMSGSST